MLVTCKNCEVEVNPAFLNCRFCKQQILPNQERQLTKEQKSELLVFAKAMNTRLKKNKSNSAPAIFGVFFLFVLVLVGLGFLMNTYAYNTGSIVLALIAAACVLFICWGAFIDPIEQRYIKKAYYNHVHKDIVNFLEARGYYRYEFDMVISDKMKSNSPLKHFVFDSHVDVLGQSPF